jgi:deoxyribose-phosphate aldolase
VKLGRRELAARIDHTLLKAEATETGVRALCGEAAAYGFKSVCVNSCWVPLAVSELAGTAVMVCAAIGFPLGAMAAAAKEAEAVIALSDGARELDMVMNIGQLKGGNYAAVGRDIAMVGEHCRKAGAGLKVILETALLTQEEKVVACRLAVGAGAQFVKTSTGFGPGGAAVEDVELMRRTVGAEVGVKASGGIRSYEDAMRMIAAGANRIGASASVRIVEAAE